MAIEFGFVLEERKVAVQRMLDLADEMEQRGCPMAAELARYAAHKRQSQVGYKPIDDNDIDGV